jgi:ornithine cyclodeaminase/alanine dehydrogenase-like protein (mu-crystallin family)
MIRRDQMIELEEMILNPALRRISDDQITIADLTGVTGVAIQDLQIAIQCYETFSK